MERDEFLERLGTLIDEAKVSNVHVVRQSAVVLLGLKASIIAGEEFFESYVDNAAMVIKNQKDIVEELIKNSR